MEVAGKEENNNKKMTVMSTSQSILIRLSIVLGMAAAVATILYLTPMPNQHFKSCDRPCHDLDWPMICRVKLNIEMYRSINHVCKGCQNSDYNNCNNSFCSVIDRTSRSLITANQQLPGPPIHVCQNDILIVDVINKMPGHSLTLHWRGQPNHEAPFMDGVPMVTQCPIPSYTTFQYKFRASAPGTHLYHAFADSDRSNGLFGALIVRQANKIDPHKRLYDVDLKEHAVLISEWSGDLNSNINDDKDLPKALLINGKAPSALGSPLSVFTVKKGRRYRFRVAYTGGILGCPINITVDKHTMKIIALDGNPVNAYEVTSAELGKGERLDFILKTNRDVDAYFLRVTSNCYSNSLHGLAVIDYEGSSKKRSGVKEEKRDVKDHSHSYPRHFETSFCESQIGKVCLSDVKSFSKIEKELRHWEVDKQIYLGFDYKAREKHFSNVSAPLELQSKIYKVNNFTFTFPSSPILTQPADILRDQICNEHHVPEKCIGKQYCECTEVLHIPLGESVEIILIDQTGDEDGHVFHLHGNSFNVMGAKVFDRTLSVAEAKELDAKDELVKRNLAYSVRKDTIRVPKYGVVVIRFVAKNPGFWMLRDEKSRGWTKGMDVILQVGEISEMVATPSNFPACGSYVGPDFYLL